MRQIRAEAREQGDVVVLPVLDYYSRIHFKVVHMLQWLLDHQPRATYLVKLDDDFCLDLHVLGRMLQRAAGRPFVYGGVSLWPGPHPYAVQRGLDDSSVKYIGGGAAVWSRPLAVATLAVTDPPIAFYHLEAWCGEDCTVGRWIAHAEAQANRSGDGPRVAYLEEFALLTRHSREPPPDQMEAKNTRLANKRHPRMALAMSAAPRAPAPQAAGRK